jgi:hypothetical protein
MTEMVHVDAGMREFELDQRRAKAYSESGYWPDTASIAKALVKIEAGRSLGLPALVAMSEVHVIEGKPTLGAGALASLVRTSGRYDYKVMELTAERCTIRFFDRGAFAGDSVFVLEDAKNAGLLGRGPWKQYPRNMLFARAISNGVAWFCPDVVSGRVYTPEEIDQSAPPGDLPADLVDDEIPFGDPVEALDAVEEYELVSEYLNENDENAVVEALQEELDAKPEPGV